LRVLRKFTDFVLFSNIFISLCAAASAWETFLLAGKTNWHYLLFVFCSTFVFYNMQRVLLSRDYVSEDSSERHRWIARHIRLLTVLSGIAFIASIPLVIKWEWKLVLVFAFFCVLATLYFIPKVNLRTIPGLKAVYISLLWTFSTVVFPSLLIGFRLEKGYLWLLAAERFFFILPLCIVFNIRDIDYDRKRGVRTLPVLIGVGATKIISASLVFIFSALLIYRCYFYGLVVKFGESMQPFVPALLVSGLITLLALLFADKKRSEYYYILVVDGMILLQAVLVFLTEVFL